MSAVDHIQGIIFNKYICQTKTRFGSRNVYVHAFAVPTLGTHQAISHGLLFYYGHPLGTNVLFKNANNFSF